MHQRPDERNTWLSLIFSSQETLDLQLIPESNKHRIVKIPQQKHQTFGVQTFKRVKQK